MPYIRVSTQIKKIIILNAVGIGDVLMVTPTIRRIREEMPAVHISALVLSRSAYQILETCPYVDKVIYVDPNIRHNISHKMRVLFSLRRQKFDVSITVFGANKMRYNLLAWMIGARYRITFNYPIKKFKMPFLQNIKVDFLPKHEVLLNLSLLIPIGIKSKPPNGLEIWLTGEDIALSQRWLKVNDIRLTHQIIGIHPGSSILRKMVYKRWPIQNFVNLCQLITKVETQIKILIFCGPQEAQIKKIFTSLAIPSVVVVSDLRIRETAALIKKCSLFISNDSGLMHIAAALKVPVVALFGPTDTKIVGPYGTPNIIIKRDFTCRPCWSSETYGQIPDCRCMVPYDCIRGITVIDVFKTIKGMDCKIPGDERQSAPTLTT